MILFTIPAIIIVTAVFFTYLPTSKFSHEVSNTALHPSVVVLPNKDESATGYSLKELSAYTTGLTPSKQEDRAGIPITVTDNSHVQLTLYDGNASDGTVIAVKATNISSLPITLTGMNILGAVVNKQGTEFTNLLNAAAIGCTDNSHFDNDIVTVYANGTSISHTENQTVVCNNAATHSVMTLDPGESVTADVTTSLNTDNGQISQVSASASYNLGSGSYEYTMMMPYQSIK